MSFSMGISYKIGIRLTFMAMVFLFSLLNCEGQVEKTKNSWMEYNNIEEAGFSAFNLDSQLKDSNLSSLMVIHEGKVAYTWGDVTRRLMIHSIRKSIMSALIGIEVEKGNIDLSENMKSIGIDDINALTETEKEATVEHLLNARSGIYHASAYSPRSMIENLPARGSHLPGSYWYYNNWDFNTLLSIYEKKTGRNFFEAFKEDIADKIGMEDFRLTDTHYRFEKDKSVHAAYLFNISCRDLARFGQLYLNEGKWNGIQIIPESWVKKSTSAISNDLGRFAERGSYGYLWWVGTSPTGTKMVFGSGSGGHRVIILPEDQMVIVTRVNTFENNSIGNEEINGIVKVILDAKVKSSVKNPSLSQYTPSRNIFSDKYRGSMDEFLGDYKHQFLGTMTLVNENSKYYIKNNVGKFRLFVMADDRFFTEDIEVMVVMKPASDEEKKRLMEPVFNKDRSLKEIICYY